MSCFELGCYYSVIHWLTSQQGLCCDVIQHNFYISVAGFIWETAGHGSPGVPWVLPVRRSGYIACGPKRKLWGESQSPLDDTPDQHPLDHFLPPLFSLHLGHGPHPQLPSQWSIACLPPPPQIQIVSWDFPAPFFSIHLFPLVRRRKGRKRVRTLSSWSGLIHSPDPFLIGPFMPKATNWLRSCRQPLLYYA